MNPQDQADADAAFQRLAAVQLAQGTSATFAVAGRADSLRPAGPQAKRGLRGPQQRGRATAQVVLVQDSRGVLRWDYRAAPGAQATGGAPGLRRSAGGARSRYRGSGLAGRVIASAEAAEIGPNEITAALQNLDLRLTPQQGLRLLPGAALGAPGQTEGSLAGARRLLLLVHGTFSKGDMYTEHLPASFFSAARRRYSHLAAFDHPTLSVSPILNAIDLETALRQAGLPEKTPVDVVCHSRGGLVASWWLRSTRFRAEKLVAVGAPLTGTSLASPYRVRYLLDYFANFSKVLSDGLQGAAMVPTFASGFLAGASGLMGILGSVSSALAAFPVADAGIALVPGLHGQSRVTNNAELGRLWDDARWSQAGGGLQCYVISSNFEARREAPWWNVVAQLKQLPWVAADGITDRLFPGQNDLVVDTVAMSEKIAVADTLAFEGSSAVHHCAYFTQPETVAALKRWLLIP